MCFGNAETGQKDTSYTANPAVSGAATSNLNFAQNMQSSGFQPYTGQMVANFSPQQSESFGMADAIGASPNLPTAAGYINNAATAGPSSVNASTIASQMDPYMNQFVGQALAPQLEQMQQQFDTQNKGAAANATMAGAFGNDSQDALYRSNLTNQQDISRQGLIGQAYTNAFNTAIGAGAQDVSNSLNAQTTNAGLNEQALQRQMQGATGLENLTTSQEGVANTVNQMGQQQTAQQQAGLNANYQQYQNAQQYPFLTTELMNQTIGAGAQAMPASSTATTYAPNNSGYAVAGAALPALLAFADGGSPPVGQTSLVGEQGPELAVPTSSMTPNVNPSMFMPPSMAMPQIQPTAAPAQQQQGQQQDQQQANNNTPLGQVMAGYKLGNSIVGAGGGGGSDFSMFGNGTGAMAPGQAGWSDMGTGGTMYPMFADGGTPPVGTPSIVGEKGPELIVPTEPMTIIPNHVLRAAAAKRDAKKQQPADAFADVIGAAA